MTQHKLNRAAVLVAALVALLLLAACGGDTGDEAPATVARATLPPENPNAPVYSPTPTVTPSPTVTPTPSLTPTVTPSPTSTPTLTRTPTVPPTPTAPLVTLTPPSVEGAPAAYDNPPAELAPAEGWSCGDFPCADDLDGWLQRIQVPPGYTLSHYGRFPGQPMQITPGPDGRLYATLLLDGTREGGVFALDAAGSAEQIGPAMVSPLGLAFQPGTDVLYVSAREQMAGPGRLWRVETSTGEAAPVPVDLPCCFGVIDNQPAGMVFGPDGWLYLGVGALTDRAEPADPARAAIADLHPNEAAVLRLQPHTGEVEVYAAGIRYPYDLTFDAGGRFYATDNGILEGPGDRVLALEAGGFYGWPYYRTRGCADCPARDFSRDVLPDLLALPPYTLPRGIVAYTGTQFPRNLYGDLFVALWHGTPNAQRVIRIDPAQVAGDPAALDPYGYVPEPFVTGLIRPVDVALAPDGSLLVADFIYGHVWRVRYDGVPGLVETAPDATPEATLPPSSLFVTATPRP